VESPVAGVVAAAGGVAEAVTAPTEPLQSQVEQVAATAGASLDTLGTVTAGEPVGNTVQSLADGVASGAGGTAEDVVAFANRSVDGVAPVGVAVAGGGKEGPLTDVLAGADRAASAAGAGSRDAGVPSDFLQGLLGDVGTLIPETAEAGPATIPSLLGPPVADVAEPALATADAGAAAATGEAAPVTPESLVETVQSLPEDLAAGPGVLADLLTTVADATADSVAAAAEAIPAEEFLLVSGGIAAAAAIAAYAGRATAAGINAPLLFTSLRLIPFYAAETAQQYVANAVARTVDVVERLDSIRPTRSTFAEAKSLVPSADGFVRSFRDGFSRGARALTDDGGEGATDSRLMMQIGMLLGFAYLGFLTVWFWATRLRPHQGA
jgi:hypothetical protein